MRDAAAKRGSRDTGREGLASLASRFSFKKPVGFSIGARQRVDCTPSGADVRLSGSSAKSNLPELLALAKLGESDHLLATFNFLRSGLPHEEEDVYCSDFHELCGPLQDAWAFRTLRLNAPDLYEKVIAEAESAAESEAERINNISKEEPSCKRYVLGLMAVLHECPNPRLRINVDPEPGSKDEVSAYIEAIREYSRMEPNVSLYLGLPVAIGASYCVRVVEQEGVRFYMVEARRAS